MPPVNIGFLLHDRQKPGVGPHSHIMLATGHVRMSSMFEEQDPLSIAYYPYHHVDRMADSSRVSEHIHFKRDVLGLALALSIA